ncbi:AAA family ATPase [Aquabacterium sp. A7-Y]|uniref:ATP-binding protein n=1 Tax=Aquabacterium sp. A7-Y TaxID=1349605 RepID=UPI00223CBDAD|nr:ATP-binding protein [Aquabacterium sp. A7-Y]MCW7537040.1 AAA family ATPase [Aquabacterium sp. A7-Y]
MKLDRLVLVNWGQIRPGDYEMGNMTLLTGETGSGKSTMLDALQTVMTAAYKGIFNYNPGQDEVSQDQRRGKSKRTLESYVVGAEYSKFSRPDGAQGYIAAVFRPDGDEEELRPFTALVAASARVEGPAERRQAQLERLELVIVDDAVLSYRDFLEDAQAGEWVPVDAVVRRLKAKYPRVMVYGQLKKDYLCGLFGRFRGRSSTGWEEAAGAARAWCQSIAYRPIGSVHELVRDEILEFDAKLLQESIERIGGLMRQVTHLKQEGSRLQASVARLSELHGLVRQTTGAFEQQVQHDLLLARLQLQADEEAQATRARQIEDDRTLIQQEAAKIAGWQARRASLDASRIGLEARKLGIAAHAQKEDLDKQLQGATQTARVTLEGLSRALMAAGLLDQTARQLSGRDLPEDFPKLRSAVKRVARTLAATSLDRLADYQDAVTAAAGDAELNSARLQQLAQAFDGANTGIEAVHAALVGPQDSVSLAVAAEEVALAQRLEEAQRAVRELGARKSRLVAGGGNYPPQVARALDLMRESLPQAHVQVLCDLIEPLSPEWQPAIEGYLDHARFNFVVDPDWETRAIDFVQARGLRSKVIQGSLCLKRANPGLVPADSIIHELKTANPVAEAYLVEQYGGVVKVRSSEELRRTPRGLTRDGKGSGSRTLFATENRELVFGRHAREAALAQAGGELERAEQDVQRLQTLASELQGIKRPLQSLREPRFEAAPLTEAARIIDAARRSLSQLNLAELNDLETEIGRIVAEIQAYEANIEAAQREMNRAEARIEAAEQAIRQIRQGQDARFQAREVQIGRLKRLCEANPERNYSVLSEEVEDMLKAGTPDLDALRRKLELLNKQPDQLLGEVRESLAAYNSQCRAEERFAVALPHHHDGATFDANYAPLVALGRSVQETLDGLRSIGLYHNRSELEKAEKSFHDVFTKQFCVEIKSRVEDGIRTLRQLNNELRNLSFGPDRFDIDWSRWEPEFEDYYAFFKAVAELADAPETVDLFGEVALSARHVQVRDRLVKLLLDEDQERATKELMRIADYRNYRRYEIWNESDSGGRIRLSEWGTGSGGQLETPAYIVRAAVVTNRLKLFEKGPSLKLLANDESFSKMDEPRARAVLGFLRDKLDLQVLSAMPTMKAGSLRDEFTREYSFTRLKPIDNGELDFISDCDERLLKGDRMRELWRRQRELAREQARLAFEAAEGEDEPALQPAPAS